MPTHSGGSRILPVLRNTSSRIIVPTPSSAPQPMRFQLMSPPITPLASAEMSAACGAASACSPAPGAPAKPKALLSRSRTGGITSEPKKLELWDAGKAQYCPNCYSSNVAHESGCSGPSCHDCGYSECS